MIAAGSSGKKTSRRMGLVVEGKRVLAMSLVELGAAGFGGVADGRLEAGQVICAQLPVGPHDRPPKVQAVVTWVGGNAFEARFTAFAPGARETIEAARRMPPPLPANAA